MPAGGPEREAWRAASVQSDKYPLTRQTERWTHGAETEKWKLQKMTKQVMTF